MKHIYIFFFFILISCGSSKEEITQYQSQIKALNENNASLQNQLKEQDTELKSLNNLVNLQRENDSLPQVIQELDTKRSSLRSNEMMTGFETTLPNHLPSGVLSTMKSLSDQYRIISDINPFFLKLNAAADGSCGDYMLRIEHVVTEKKGFILLKECNPEWYLVLGAGSTFQNIEDDLSGIATFYVEKSENVKVSYGSEGKKVNPPTREVVMFYSSDRIPAVFYSDEGPYKWEWIGD
ncbi:hypothetical protein [Flammeovirga sp. EKP202]|uniref:hypothetical protein n=1 Tax=Flammeovirga sp. EKP202 TaxID=2770592 RepID=UPI00165EEF5E|nr:hypothetical protein [Flammeovirga sp. EKP202]MBD0403647.1 hypothetical protein [Flammeovirga sp. EKP202]